MYYRILFVMCMILIFAGGCGNQKEGDVMQEGTVGYKDIETDSEAVFSDAENRDSVSFMLSIQIREAVPIQLRAKMCEAADKVDVYLYREDGDSELLLQGVSRDYTFGDWYMDTEGNFYIYFYAGDIVKIDRTGKELFRKSLADMDIKQIQGMCQLTNGKVYVTYPEGNTVSAWTLGEVNPDTGEIVKVNEVRLKGMGYIGTGENGMLYMDTNGVWEIDVESGVHTKLMMFGGTSYLLKEEPKIKAFSVQEDNSVEILRCGDKYENDVISEVLRLTDLGNEKVTLIMRGDNITNSPIGKWLKEQVFLFNQENEAYHIVLEECEYGEDEEEFARQTGVQIATGKGPDILFGDVLDDYIYGMIQKGAFVDVAPYMIQSGIMVEDYFPAAFDCWRDGEKIYGVNLRILPEGYRVSEAVLGGREVPDVETLVDSLLAWQEPSIYIRYFDSQGLLEHLLQGSENLWGMVDWETRTCDFEDELFTKILRGAKEYGYDERNTYSGIAEDRVLEQLLSFDTLADQKKEGMVQAGVLFDDGCYAVVDSISSMIAINANSTNVEGAWEFISYMLSEEKQMTLTGSSLPVNRKAFAKRIENQLAGWREDDWGAVFGYENGEYVVKYKRSSKDVTEEKIAEYTEVIEEARALPIRTVPILDIIKEEAAHYFAGMKTIEEVVAVIENRVQLYLEEHE